MSLAPSMPPAPPMSFFPKVSSLPQIEEFDPLAFWLFPDWSLGNNMSDPNVAPFWMIEPEEPPAATDCSITFLYD
jgi:hypothetical protein